MRSQTGSGGRGTVTTTRDSERAGYRTGSDPRVEAAKALAGPRLTDIKRLDGLVRIDTRGKNKFMLRLGESSSEVVEALESASLYNVLCKLAERQTLETLRKPAPHVLVKGIHSKTWAPAEDYTGSAEQLGLSAEEHKAMLASQSSAGFLFHRMTQSLQLQARARLRLLKLSQAELAQKIGVSEPRVTKILRGNDNLTLSSVAKLAQALGCAVLLKLEPINK